jgi:hypothetical protein
LKDKKVLRLNLRWLGIERISEENVFIAHRVFESFKDSEFI